MTPELWQRLKPLYNAALEMPRERRELFVVKACGSDTPLRDELQALLVANEEGTGSFDKPLLRLGQFLPASEGALSEGSIIEGRFKIIRPIGSGGMGDVYEAEDLLLQARRIALKVIRPSIARNPATLSRFKEEVLLARQVSGPNVCRIYELYVPTLAPDNGPGAFLTMEFLEGVTLADRIAGNGPIVHKEAMRVATQLCAALQSIHDAGVIHRDLKPRNVMLVPRNGAEQVVVMDFGLARAFFGTSSADQTGLTLPGTVMGTPTYMAPEQFEGAQVSPATDIYALGIVLYELITGKEPFAAHTPFGAAVRRGRRPDRPSSIRKGLPPVWDDVIAKCLEYDPVCRYQSAGEVIAALSQRKLTIVRLPTGMRLSLGRSSLLAISAVVLTGLVAAGWLRYQSSLIHKPPEEAKRWYDRGMTALREGTYLQATKALGMAVSADSKFALAHARLAEAWAELDFTGQAQSEMLIAAAPEEQRSLPDLDRKYVDAVRSTLVRDYSAAAQDYEAILNKLPEDQKADGYVDLGRAYEKAGKVKETINSYETAAKLRPDDPAPFVHLGIWKSRQRDPVGAEAAFSRAEALYQASSNQEGLAEVAYQRGYAANEEADSEKARLYLDKSLAIARQIPSVQLEVRTLSQLSSVAYNDLRDLKGDDEAIEYANQAIQLARENGLEYWSTDGFVRLGNAYVLRGDFSQAETYSQQALHLAEQNKHPRLEAAADFTLATIRDQQSKPDEEVPLARKALKYYQDFGFMNQAAVASELVVRGEEAKGDFQQALQSGNELLQLADKTHSTISIANAEETVGSVLLDLEQYPDALTHFERALAASRSIHDNEAYQALHCADLLWRVGRYGDAQKMLASITVEARKRSDIASGIQDTRAQIELSQGQYAKALTSARSALKLFTNMPSGKIGDFLGTEAIAEDQLGQAENAQRDADEFLALAHKEADQGMVAAAELVEAAVCLGSHLPGKGETFAESARVYFSEKGLKESEWRSLLYLSKSAKASGDAMKSAARAKKALDTLAECEQSWGSPAFRQYASRPDYRIELQELAKL